MTKSAATLSSPMSPMRPSGFALAVTDLLQTLSRARRMIVLFLVAGMLGGTFYAIWMMPTVYRVQATLTHDQATHSDPTVLMAEAQTLRARALAAQLASDFDLAQDPEFRPVPGPVDRAIEGLRAALWPSAPVAAKAFDPVNVISARIDVGVDREAQLLTVSMEGRDPQKTADIVNRLVALAIEGQIQKKSAAHEQAMVAVIQQLDLIQGALTQEAAAAQTLRSEIVEMDRQRDLEVLTPARLAVDLPRLDQLEHQVRSSRAVYEQLTARLKELTILRGTQTADLRVLTPAFAPTVPLASHRILFALFGLLVGAGLSLGWIILRAIWAKGFYNDTALEAATGRTVLGQIPQVRDRKRRPVEILLRQPSSLLAEAVRDLRTSVLQSDIRRPPQVIMVTSSVPDEGKSTTSVLLAQNLSAWGKKVLLIEADIRRRSFERHFKTESNRGVLSVLAGLVTLEDAVIQPEGLSLDVLVGEDAAINAADVFATARFDRFLDEAREIYDHIVVDTPPVLAVADARVIAPRADAVVYVVQSGRTTRQQVQHGLQMLRHQRVNIAGLALTRMRERDMERAVYARQYTKMA